MKDKREAATTREYERRVDLLRQAMPDLEKGAPESWEMLCTWIAWEVADDKKKRARAA